MKHSWLRPPDCEDVATARQNGPFLLTVPKHELFKVNSHAIDGLTPQAIPKPAGTEAILGKS